MPKAHSQGTGRGINLTAFLGSGTETQPGRSPQTWPCSREEGARLNPGWPLTLTLTFTRNISSGMFTMA